MFLALPSLQNPEAFPLETAKIENITQDWGEPRRNLSVEGHPLMLGGKAYARGIGTHANAEIVVALGSGSVGFSATVGLDDETAGKGSVRFRAYADGRLAAETGILRSGGTASLKVADLRGAKILRLVVDDAGDGNAYDHADLVEPVVLHRGAAPTIVGLEPGPTLPIAPFDAVRTRINGPRVLGASPEREILFRVPVTGRRPLALKASGLPAGVALDGATGILSGRVAKAGEYDVKLEAAGPGGRDRRTLRLSIGRDRLALTPPMGWNSWNVWGTNVDDAKIRAAADSLVATGLADAGYGYVNVDDAWQSPERAPDGEIRSNERFPDMAALASAVHARGLRFGLYSSPGPKTCGGYTGSYGHEAQDAGTYAKWGVDYLKYDWCSYGSIAPNPDRAALEAPYRLMSAALRSSGRDIVHSLCQYGMGDVSQWGKSAGGHLWRTTGDITDSWSSMAGIGFAQGGNSRHAGPGAWNDPDMLVLGRVGWGDPHPSRLKPNEAITHMTLWSLLAAPLLIGCDLTKLDPFTRDLLTNPEVVEIDQDALGRAATPVKREGTTEVWTRPLAGGATAVGLFNRGLSGTRVSVSARELGVSPGSGLRNVWTRKDEGRIGATLARAVPAHGALLFRIGGRG